MKFKDLKATLNASGEYFRPQEGENRIRIVSEVVRVWKAFENGAAKVYLTPEGAGNWNKTAPKANKARERYMMYVINRVTGEIQQAEFGPQVMGIIADLASSTEYGFDDLPPYDMILTKKGSGLDTEYALIPARMPTELSDAERAQISSLKDLNLVIAADAEDANPLDFMGEKSA